MNEKYQSETSYDSESAWWQAGNPTESIERQYPSQWGMLPCKNCSNHPSNGGSGVCFCVLGTPTVY